MLNEWNETWTRYRGRVGDLEKYSDLNAEIARNLKLHEGHIPPAGSVCLDISAGAGIYAYILKNAGCVVYLSDMLDRSSLLPDLWRVLGHDERRTAHYSVASNTKELPFPGVMFDHISAVAVPPMSFFDTDDWIAFIRTARARLNPGGTLYLRPNRSPGLDTLKIATIAAAQYNFDAVKISDKYVTIIKQEVMG